MTKQSHLSKTSPYFGGAKLVPSKLPHNQSVMPRTIFTPRPNTHEEEAESRAKQGNDKFDGTDPPPRLYILWSSVSLTRPRWP
jgi:hypothetical protein